MNKNVINVLTLFAGFTILFAVGLLLADIGLALGTGLVCILTRPELLLAITLFVGAWLFARNIGPSFDKLFEK